MQISIKSSDIIPAEIINCQSGALSESFVDLFESSCRVLSVSDQLLEWSCSKLAASVREVRVANLQNFIHREWGPLEL